MQNMKKNQEKQVLINEDSKKKERHIVTWTQEEDDILRDQIDKHGTENWAIIASKFKDKTTRQCRRRWYTYLNSDFKKGGWSPEEDMLLCEAQKIFGNRWTEIAKVVSGRTDNAVKNRFATLCKKRAKCEALAKENNTSYINSNNKRVILHEYNTYPVSKPDVANKMRRSHVPDDGAENISFGDRSHKQIGTPIHQQGRAPFAVLHQNSHNVNNSEDQRHVCNAKFSSYAQNNKVQGTFLKNDDSKINLLMQQAELLSSLALKVDAKNMDQSLENTWKVLQDFMNQTKESDIPRYKIPDLQLVDLKDLLEDLKSSREGIQPCWRQMELYEDCLGSSEHSTESTFLPNSCCENLEHSIHQDIEPKSIQIGDQGGVRGCDQGNLSGATLNQVADIFPSCKEQINNDGIISALSSAEFSSPLQVTPLFRSLTAGIPSPHFSESERSFLMKTLGMESPSLNLNANKTSQPPLCKRTLLHSLY